MEGHRSFEPYLITISPKKIARYVILSSTELALRYHNSVINVILSHVAKITEFVSWGRCDVSVCGTGVCDLSPSKYPGGHTHQRWGCRDVEALAIGEASA